MSHQNISNADMKSILENRIALHELSKESSEIAYDGYITAINDITFNMDSGHTLLESIEMCIEKYKKLIEEFEQASLESAAPDEETEGRDEFAIEVRSGLQECEFIKSIVESGNFNILEQRDEEVMNSITVNLNGVITVMELNEDLVWLFEGSDNPAFHIIKAFEKLRFKK